MLQGENPFLSDVKGRRFIGVVGVGGGGFPVKYGPPLGWIDLHKKKNYINNKQQVETFSFLTKKTPEPIEIKIRLPKVSNVDRRSPFHTLHLQYSTEK